MKYMKYAMNLILICILCAIVNNTYSQKVIFLHHSTGNNVYNEGNVASLVDSYNKTNGKSLVLTERSYPNEPWTWSNYPYDYWKLWIGGLCNSANPNIECMNTLAEKYDMVIMKHCFPGADILPNTGKPDVNSDLKTLENYKEQYRALRSLFDSYPRTKFMIWTLTPLHRLDTSPENALRAYEFVKWVNKEWLTEDGKSHPNIFIFDFYSLIADLKENQANSVRYCLKYNFEISHTDSNSHPNVAANQYVGPIFVKAITDALNKK